MIVRELAAAVAASVAVGKRVLLVVGTIGEAEEYRRVAETLAPKGKGHVTVLVASVNNGSDWRSARFDSVEVCPSVEGHEGWQDLAREAATRATPTAGKAKPLPRELRHAIKRGRRPKGATG